MKIFTRSISKAGFVFALFSGVLSLVTYLQGINVIPSCFLIVSLVLVALSLQGIPEVKSASFTIWMFVIIAIAINYPSVFTEIGGFHLKLITIPLLQLIMFGMGAAMNVQDFLGVLKMPRGVFVGLLCQFTIMPFVGYALAVVSQFPPEIATGVILIGVSPSGLASNVMAFIANANLALSVALTAISTLLAPFITPLLMKTLAGQFISIDFLAMMLSILKIVIFPIVAGLAFNHWLSHRFETLNKIMPAVSMAAIAVIVGMIVATGRDKLFEVGFLLLVVCLIHNIAGYIFGYLGAKVAGLSEKSCRTVSLEVGLQNGGLATGLAIEMGKIATVGLAPVLFSSIMNITGSSLAIWWRGKSKDESKIYNQNQKELSD